MWNENVFRCASQWHNRSGRLEKDRADEDAQSGEREEARAAEDRWHVVMPSVHRAHIDWPDAAVGCR